MILPQSFEDFLNWLRLRKDEKKLLRRLGTELIEELRRSIPNTIKPKQLYLAATHLLGRGKLIRGILTLLINQIYGFKNKGKVLKLASAVELLHNASLIHDDIIDESDTRRGIASVHKEYGLGIAIVSADLLISIAYNLISELGVEIIEKISKAGVLMSQGEALEEVVSSPNLDEYFEVIDGKSASLVEAACFSSALISGGTREEVNAFACYGKYAGRALQIRDDILDYIDERERRKSNIVSIFIDAGKPLTEALQLAATLSKEMVDKALSSLSFLNKSRRRIFEELANVIVRRPY